MMRERRRLITRAQDRDAPSLPVLASIAGALFLIWSNSFVAASYLLGGEGAAATFDLRMSPLEWVGGGLALTGLAIAVLSEGR